MRSEIHSFGSTGYTKSLSYTKSLIYNIEIENKEEYEK